MGFWGLLKDWGERGHDHFEFDMVAIVFNDNNNLLLEKNPSSKTLFYRSVISWMLFI